MGLNNTPQDRYTNLPEVAGDNYLVYKLKVFLGIPAEREREREREGKKMNPGLHVVTEILSETERNNA